MLKLFGSVPVELWARLLRDVRDIIDCVVKSVEGKD